MGITYLNGDATDPIGPGFKILAHICNDLGGWGAGFVVAISQRWREPEVEYRVAHARGELKLGDVQFVPIDGEELLVANMIAQGGFETRDRTGIFVRYTELEKCLTTVAKTANSLRATVHMPRIGTGLAGGRWEVVEPIIRRTMGKVPVRVYDYE